MSVFRYWSWCYGSGLVPLLNNASSSTRKAFGAPTGVCPNCWARTDRHRLLGRQRTSVVDGGWSTTQFSLQFFGPAMLTNFELDAELDVIHERPCEARFRRLFPHNSFSPSLFWPSTARQRTSVALGVGS